MIVLLLHFAFAQVKLDLRHLHELVHVRALGRLCIHAAPSQLWATLILTSIDTRRNYPWRTYVQFQHTADEVVDIV